MRFVPINRLKEGMIVGKKLYGQNGMVLIAKNTKLERVYINRIKKMGYSGVYIQDNLSEDIEINAIIDENLKIKAVNNLKKIFTNVNAKERMPDEYITESKYIIKDIVDNIINNKNILVNIIDLKFFDDYTYYHSINVAIMSIIIGVALKLKKNELYELGLGAILHDIGKIFINKNILNKKGKLDEEEFKTIKKHPKFGYEHLKKNNISIKSKVAILQHHERFDGYGYPNKMQGKEISLFGRIITIADVYDALTSDRPYRKALTPSEAIEYIMANAEIMFDSKLIKAFVSKIAPYPVGTCVQLSNGLIGIVYKNHYNAILRPKIKVITNEKNEIVKPYIIDLFKDRNYFNVTVIKITEN